MATANEACVWKETNSEHCSLSGRQDPLLWLHLSSLSRKVITDTHTCTHTHTWGAGRNNGDLHVGWCWTRWTRLYVWSTVQHQWALQEGRLYKKVSRPRLGLRVVDLNRGHQSLFVSFLLKDSFGEGTRSRHTPQSWKVSPNLHYDPTTSWVLQIYHNCFLLYTHELITNIQLFVANWLHSFSWLH